MAGWIKCSDLLPAKEGEYLVWHKPEHLDVGFAGLIKWCDGWNCSRSYETGEIYREHELKNVVAWQPIEPYKEGEQNEQINI